MQIAQIKADSQDHPSGITVTRTTQVGGAEGNRPRAPRDPWRSLRLSSALPGQAGRVENQGDRADLGDSPERAERADSRADSRQSRQNRQSRPHPHSPLLQTLYQSAAIRKLVVTGTNFKDTSQFTFDPPLTKDADYTQVSLKPESTSERNETLALNGQAPNSMRAQ